MTSPLLLTIARLRNEAGEHLAEAEERMRALSKLPGMRSVLADITRAKKKLDKTWPLAKNKRKRTSRR